LSVRHQCELLGLNRSSFYYEPAKETIENLRLMRRIDEQYLKPPFFGSRGWRPGWPVRARRSTANE
jgi:putative transposase